MYPLRTAARIVLAAVTTFSLCAAAQDRYPTRTITIVSPFPPGGTSDLASGKVRAYAQWGAKRLAAFPEVPTFAEQGYKIEYYLWGGLFAPKNIPPQVFESLRDAVRQAAKSPDFVKGMEKIRTPIAYQDADEFKAFWDQDAAKLARVIQRIGKVGEK